LGLLAKICFGSSCGELNELILFDMGVLLLMIGLAVYFYLDWKLAIPFGFVLLSFYFLGRTLSTPVCWFLFISGWILQGIGHYVYEKNSPAFLKNFIHIFIGPIWIFAKILGYR
jgi:uncharacterized membrane protein YGL010W